MAVQKTINNVTDRITKRSSQVRADYLNRMDKARRDGPARAHLTCGNQAHAYAAMGDAQSDLADGTGGNLAIVTAYNDMLSAHQPFETYPKKIKEAARAMGCTAQVAGGVPAMCDGVTQGQTGMELSLFSRDTIAMAAGIALSHNVFDAAVFLGVCDKIVPGLVIAAATFGYMPSVFIPAGPMTSGISNDEKARVRNAFAEGKCDRAALMKSEMASYHGPGTCTFYGTANTNQMLMEFMGLHLPGTSFINPGTPLRDALTTAATQRALSLSHLTNHYTPTSEILSEKAFVNGIVGLMATGGSTNLLIHLIAMARAAGVILDWEDFEDVSRVTPLLTKIYPNGLADVNHFHAAGGLALVIRHLMEHDLLHDDTVSVAGGGIELYTQEPKLRDGALDWEDGPKKSLNDKIVASPSEPFQSSGGLVAFRGNLGSAVMKVSAVREDRRTITAPVRVFQDQSAVQQAFHDGEFVEDVIVVVRYQGPKANGMPELHGLTPCLSVLQDRGIKVALLTDGRMSGASGKVPAAIHVSPEALEDGPIAYLRDGDVVTIDASQGTIAASDPSVFDRPLSHPNLEENDFGVGRELFKLFRAHTSPAATGASIFGEPTL
ncbi:MAG: phosphogluconate dehydratase [Pseudomonadota bacterium]